MGREIRKVPLTGWQHPKDAWGNYFPLNPKEMPEIPDWDDNYGFCIYETVSEGTPVSPVFETMGDMENWLLRCGYSPKVVARFSEKGWCPSVVVCGVVAYYNFNCLEIE
jgi:hypothetical protein